MALKLVLMLAQENGVSQIQIYGDSLLVIQWMKGEFNLHNFTLQPLFHDILLLKSTFSHISFMHVYMDMNYEADKLSKDGVALENGILEDHQQHSYTLL
jgi:ribonuclease HI